MSFFYRNKYVNGSGIRISAVIAMTSLVISFGAGAYPIKARADIRELDEATGCSFVVPKGFYPCEVKGLYVNEHYPLESANVSYSITELPKEKKLTNAEKASGKEEPQTDEEILYDELSDEIYEEIQRENYEAIYGENVEFSVDSFEETSLDGYPEYVIESHFTVPDTQTIYQTSHIILSANKIFTIVYSRAEDDYFAEVFQDSMNTIHVR